MFSIACGGDGGAVMQPATGLGRNKMMLILPNGSVRLPASLSVNWDVGFLPDFELEIFLLRSQTQWSLSRCYMVRSSDF